MDVHPGTFACERQSDVLVRIVYTHGRFYVCREGERVIAFGLEARDFSAYPLTEVLPVLVLWLCPSDFGDGDDAWINHVLYLLFGRDIFPPQVALHAEDILFLAFVQHLGDWVIGIHFLQCQIAADGFRLGRWVGLIGVEIAMAARHHDHVVLRLGRLDAPLFAAP